MAEPLLAVRGFLLDMDGTFYLGDRLLPGALAFAETLRRQGKDFLFLTNNSTQRGRQYAEKIARLGLDIPETKVLTSGEATARYLLSHRAERRAYVVGTPLLEEEFREHGFTLDGENPELAILGFDTTLTYAKLWKLCDLVRAGLPYIATHPDFNCPTETGFMPDIGAMIAFVRASTGRDPDVVIGKPNRMIVEAAAEKLSLPPGSLAMVGDRLYTDIALGQTAGIVTVLVWSGETRPADLDGSPFQPTYTFDHLGGLADWLEKNG
jgi:HAD superfamily hydrolase (TIGR01457 family)